LHQTHRSVVRPPGWRVPSTRHHRKETAITTMAHPAPARVTVGVDTHLDIHVAHAKDAMGRRLGTCSIPATPAGYAELLDWARAFGEVQAWGVEGTGSYGAGLARLLRDQGQVVVEVNRPDRSTRCLRVARATAMKARTQAINAIKALLVTVPAELREQLRGLPAARLVTAARLEPDSLASPTAAAKLALCTLARRYQALSSEITTLSSELERLTAAAAPLVAAGDNPDRLHSEASFSMLCGSGTLGRWLRNRRNPSCGAVGRGLVCGPCPDPAAASARRAHQVLQPGCRPVGPCPGPGGRTAV
jgi:transposase